MSTQLIRFAIASGALKLSPEPTFKLKSGRMSPHFFNAGDFSTGKTAKILAEAYATAINEAEIKFDCLYGPPYKGISLSALAAAAYWEQFFVDIGFAYSRKETKEHGEGGDMVGASLEGRKVILIDDVVTDGATKREAIELVRSCKGIEVAVAIAFDRQERGVNSELSGAQEITRDFGIPVIAAATTQELIRYLETDGGYPQELAAIRTYQSEYGVSIG